MLPKGRGSSTHILAEMLIKRYRDNRDYNSIEGEKGDSGSVWNPNYGRGIQIAKWSNFGKVICSKRRKVMMIMNKKNIKNRKTRKTSSFHHGLIN